MSFKRTLVILGIFLLFLGYFHFFETKKVPKNPEANMPKAVNGLAQDKIDRLTIQKYKKSVVCQREKDGWFITAPRHIKADDETVEKWLSYVMDLKAEQVIDENPADLAAYGLTEPVVRGVMEIKGSNTKIEILVGDTNPTNTLTYLKLSDAPRVYGVNTSVKNALDKSLYDLRDKVLLHLQEEAVDKIRVESEKGALVLKKKKDQWFLVEPTRHLAQTNRINTVIQTFSRGTAEAYMQEPMTTPRSYGLDKPFKTITFWEGTKKSSVSFGKKSENNQKVFYATRSTLSDCVKVQEFVPNTVFERVEDFADKNLFHFVSTDVKSMEMQRGELQVKASRVKDNHWKIQPKPFLNITEDQVNDLITALMNLEYAKEMPSRSMTDAKGGWNQPQATVLLNVPSGQLVLRAGKESPDQKVYVKTQDPEKVFLVDKSILDKVPKLK